MIIDIASITIVILPFLFHQSICNLIIILLFFTLIAIIDKNKKERNYVFKTSDRMAMYSPLSPMNVWTVNGCVSTKLETQTTTVA